MLKKGIIYIINFFFIICIFALLILFISSNTILSKNYIIGMLDTNNYYMKIYYNINDGTQDYIIQSGLEENLFYGLYDIEKINNDVNMLIDAIYENKDINIDTQTIKTTLDSRINQAFLHNNKTISNKEKLAIEILEKNIIDVYKSKILYSKTYVEKIGDVYSKINQIITKLKIIIIIITILLLSIIIIINKNLRETIRILGISLLSSGILAISIKLFIGNRIDNIQILNAAFSENIVYLVNAIANTFLISGIIMSIIGLISIIFSSINIKEKKHMH